jgi:hypothetical protein
MLVVSVVRMLLLTRLGMRLLLSLLRRMRFGARLRLPSLLRVGLRTRLLGLLRTWLLCLLRVGFLTRLGLRLAFRCTRGLLGCLSRFRLTGNGLRTVFLTWLLRD